MYSNVDYQIAWGRVEFHLQIETYWFRKTTHCDYKYLLSLSDDAFSINLHAYQQGLIPSSVSFDQMIDPYARDADTPLLYNTISHHRARQWFRRQE